ncbi:MAG: L-aspartate oxidase [Corynebacteriales bacterium]|nr:L-aspartate oxidase [Mycobacteriales bacterium]
MHTRQRQAVRRDTHSYQCQIRAVGWLLVPDIHLPLQLAAPKPGWTTTTDVVVVGSGVAGLNVALGARAAGHKVTLVTKVNIDDGSTRWAQGGIAAVLDPHDTPAAHAQDTEVAGVGLCDPIAVKVLTEEGPARLHELIARGAEFDRDPQGQLLLTREGGHHANRIVHAGGDATGAEVQRALHEAINSDDGITLIEHALVLDLLKDKHGRAAGVTLHVLGEGSSDGVGAVLARAVVLATGGMGQIFHTTTNPTVSTGDGVALALRAGAAVADLEFMQFHPTALFLSGDRAGRQPLVSEALRGEGAHLVDANGTRFMLGAHELAELAPRDVVAKGITRVMREQGLDHVFLDARPLAHRLEARFPTIVASCRAAGIDPLTELIPVAPAAHYASGGVRTDLYGQTSIPGLFACGEVACTGVHGANRLASNSLLEGLVFAGRITEALSKNLPAHAEPVSTSVPTGLISASVRPALTQAMTLGAGVLRNASSLGDAAETLAKLSATQAGEPGPDEWETTNLLTVAAALTQAATVRQETRGCHWRDDFADAEPAWHRHVIQHLTEAGVLSVTFEPVHTEPKHQLDPSNNGL